MSVIMHNEDPYENANWRFLQEGMVVAVSDSLFGYENMSVTPWVPRRGLCRIRSAASIGSLEGEGREDRVLLLLEVWGVGCQAL